MAEKYYSVSPYAFCSGNPVNFVDWNGEDIAKFDTNGNLLSYKERKGKDVIKIYSLDANTQKHKLVKKQKFEKDAISKPVLIDDNMLVFESKSNSTSVFEFLVTNTNVEWSIVEYNDGSPVRIGNSHQENSDKTLIKSIRENISNVITATHSHPTEPYPSSNDKRVVRMFKNHDINFMIFHKPTSKYIKYNSEKALYDEEDYMPF